MRLDMAVLQYEKHPSQTSGINFYARAHGHFLGLDGIWRDFSEEVFNMLAAHPSSSKSEFEELRLRKLRDDSEKDLKWALNRLRWTGRDDSLGNAASVASLTDPWFRFRMLEIERSALLHPKTAGPVKKRARIESSAAFSAMYVALRALESDGGQPDLAALGRTALARPQSL